jgi:hypothetical protein
LETDIAPVNFSADEDAVAIGSEVYLIGHVDGEGELPTPSVARGLVTRIRQWTSGNMSYLQTDIPVEKGQSGGVLMSDRGEVIGLVGHVITRNDFALAAWSVDVLSQVTELISGDDSSERIDRKLPDSGGALEHDLLFERSDADGFAFVLNAPLGADFEITIEADSFTYLLLSGPKGEYIFRTTAYDGKIGKLDRTILTGGPHMITITTQAPRSQIHLISNLPLIEFDDPDHQTSITIPAEIKGVIDYSSDADRFSIDLEQGESIYVAVESLNFQPTLSVGFVGALVNQRLQASPKQPSSLAHTYHITYLAPFTGEYVLSVSGGFGRSSESVGFGYTLSVSKAADGTVARTVEPNKFPRPASADESANSEKLQVQDALTGMMADMGLSEMASSTNSVNSWSHYPSEGGVNVLHPTYLDLPTTEFFYCWDTEGTISFQFTMFAVCPLPPPPPGTPYDGMSQPRSGHTATMLSGGDVLVVGGDSSFSGPIASAETFVTVSEKWMSASPINQARSLHTETALDDGNVLITGGQTDFGGAISSAELYNRTEDSWSLTGEMSEARVFHTANKLSDGKVLVAGGTVQFERSYASAEIYDPATGVWNTVSPMSMPHALHTATLMDDGRVLVAGGLTNGDNITGSAEIFDPLSATWTQTGQMANPRAFHSATLLSDGKVLVTGGISDAYGTMAPTAAEVYDPVTGEWETVGRMNLSRANHTATLLIDGRVLIVGGDNDFETLNSVEIYDPFADEWSMIESMTLARVGHTATLLEAGQVIVIGGEGGGGFIVALGSSEVYDPATASWTYIEGSEALFGNASPRPAAPAPAPAAAPADAKDYPRPAPTLTVINAPPFAPAPTQ